VGTCRGDVSALPYRNYRPRLVHRTAQACLMLTTPPRQARRMPLWTPNAHRNWPALRAAPFYKHAAAVRSGKTLRIRTGYSPRLRRRTLTVSAASPTTVFPHLGL